MKETILKIDEFVKSKSPHLIVTPDSGAIVKAQKDKEFLEIINTADLVTPDEKGILFAAKIFNQPFYERISGIDLMQKICEKAEIEEYLIFLLGAKEGVAEKCAENLKNIYPKLKIVGTHHGYFSEDEEKDVIKKIKSQKPDVLFVAMGIPKQEKWINKNLKELNVPVCIGVGGSFDVISGRLKRAPKWMQDFGLEWLFRTIQEPKRILRIFDLPKFIFMIFKTKYIQKTRKT
jgi:N-acetylglucosaminyldiphosphoundecaprenol N-acetyl-beta-D-mannosaminyltransferase